MDERVARWLTDEDFEQYLGSFRENDIGWDLLHELDHETLTAMGVSAAGHRIRMLRSIRELRSCDSGQSTRRHRPTDAAPAERRQLTVAFCDLVGSSRLAGQLDPEDLREVIRAYQATAANAVHRYGGHIAQHLGDGLLVYFGYPTAHEDDVQRAMLAALLMLEGLPGLNAELNTRFQVSLSLRIAVHTGPVVVGEVGESAHQELLALGETPNLAARLQSVAAAGTVVISESTRQLLGDRFALRSLGPQHLTGIAEPVPAFEIVAPNREASRFEAIAGGRLEPIAGRSEELQALRAHWYEAARGRGRLILLTGESGIGKSRLVKALEESVPTEGSTCITIQCSPYHMDNALYPVAQHLAAALPVREGQCPEQRLDLLEASLEGGPFDDVPGAVQLLSNLVGLGEAAVARYGAPSASPQERRRRTLDVLRDWFVESSRQIPSLLVFEDAHWIDPTTLELIERLRGAIMSRPVLIVVTARPGFPSGLSTHPEGSVHILGRLRPEHSREIIIRVAGRRRLPEELVGSILERTDGVPLYLEELTKAVIESDDAWRGPGFDPAGMGSALSVPNSLHDALLARLDRLGPLKVVAQTAACIGRRFDLGLLSVILDTPEVWLRESISKLERSGLVVRHDETSVGRYSFKHALVRDAAYQSLLRTTRRALHKKILDALESIEGTPHVVLAQHAEGAGDLNAAAAAWERAGDESMQRPAFGEAIRQYSRAIAAVGEPCDGRSALTRELGLQVKRLRALQAARGFAHSETKDALERARALLESLGSRDHRHPVLIAIWSAHHSSGDHGKALKVAREVLAGARTDSDIPAMFDWVRNCAISETFLGRFDVAERHYAEALGYYDPSIHHTSRSAIDVLVNLLGYRAIGSICRGDQRRTTESLDLLEARTLEVDHVHSFGAAFLNRSLVDLIGRLPGGLRRTEAGLAFCSKAGLGMWHAGLQCIHGALLLLKGSAHEAAKQLLEGSNARDAMGTLGFSAFYMTHLLVALREAGDDENAERVRSEVIRRIDDGHDEWALAEIRRLLALDSLKTHKDQAAALDALHGAMRIANAQGAALWRLRTAQSIGRIHIESGRTEPARDLLALAIAAMPVSDAPLPDLVHARELVSRFG